MYEKSWDSEHSKQSRGLSWKKKWLDLGNILNLFFFKTDARPVLPICHKFCPRDFPTSTIFADEKQLEALRDLEILDKISHQKEEFQV